MGYRGLALSFLAAAGLFLASCANHQLPTPSGNPTSTPSFTPGPSHTPTPTATITATWVATTTTCAAFQFVTVGSYVVEPNYWNQTTCPGTQCMVINNSTGAFSVTQAPNCGSNVESYPNVLYGCSFGECSPGGALPKQVSALTCIASNWSFSVGGSPSDQYDVAYDIWFCPNNSCGSSGFNGGTELMIWLDYLNTPGWQNDQGSVSIDGADWELWQATQTSGSNSWTYLAYLAKANTTSVSGFDLMAFFQDALSRNFIQSSWYLYAVQAGIELMTGGIPYNSNSFSVTVNSGC